MKNKLISILALSGAALLSSTAAHAGELLANGSGYLKSGCSWSNIHSENTPHGRLNLYQLRCNGTAVAHNGRRGNHCWINVVDRNKYTLTGGSSCTSYSISRK